MDNKSRILSILNTPSLDPSITGLPSFNLSELVLNDNIDFQLPTNLRLGHVAENVVSELIHRSENYNMLKENVQLINDKKTIGELDFIIQNMHTDEIFHMEMAYKFYLLDPNHSMNQKNNWIGPNKNDSLTQKLWKTKQKQFPLLYSECAKDKLVDLPIEKIRQVLCLLVSLFVPYEYIREIESVYKKAIVGYYLNYSDFISINNRNKYYFIPPKTSWGIDPSVNNSWTSIHHIDSEIVQSLEQRQSLLVWQKEGQIFTQFFIVWW